MSVVFICRIFVILRASWVEYFRKFNTIATASFRCVECSVGLSKQLAEFRHFSSMKTCNPKAGCNPESASFKSELVGLQLVPEPINCDLNIRLFNMGYHHDKLFASDATTYVRRSRVRPEKISELLQDDVAGFMSVSIIHTLERVQICHHDPKRKTVPGRPAELADRPIFNSPAVWEAGERVSQRQFF